MSEPRFAIKAHLGRAGGIDRFLADYHARGQETEAHMLWVSGPESARQGAAMMDAARLFKAQPHQAVVPVLASSTFSGGWLVLQEGAVMLSVNEAADGRLPEAALVEIGVQTAGLMAHLSRVQGAQGLHRHLSGDTLFVTREGRLRIDAVLAAAGRWPMRTDTNTLADPPNDSWSLGVLIVELLGGQALLEQLEVAMQNGRTPATHRGAVKKMLRDCRATAGLAAVTLDLLDWYADKRTPVAEAGRRLMALGPDASELARFADALPQVTWGWRDDAHPMVGVGTMVRGGQGAVGARHVERVRPTRGAGRRLIETGESTDFIQNQKYASTPAATSPTDEVDPLSHFSGGGPSSAVSTVLDEPPQTNEAPPPPPAPVHVPPPLPAKKPFPVLLVAAVVGLFVFSGMIFFFLLTIILWLGAA